MCSHRRPGVSIFRDWGNAERVQESRGSGNLSLRFFTRWGEETTTMVYFLSLNSSGAHGVGSTSMNAPIQTAPLAPTAPCSQR